MSENIGDRFLAFEQKNNLFKLKTDDDIYIWDIVRFDIYVNLMWDYSNRPIVKTKIKNKVFLLCKGLGSYMSFLCNRSTYDNLFFVFSRNLQKNHLTDLISIDTQKTVKKNGERNFIFESNIHPTHLLAETPTNTVHLQYLFRKLQAKKNRYDFSKIIDLIYHEFGKCPLSNSDLELIIHNFLSDKLLFSRLLRRHKVKKVFLTQNGIQKGLLAAAKNLHIPTYEFQHGIVDRGHITYSYALSDLCFPQVILPEHLLSLGCHWFKDIKFPSVNLTCIGNDYFANEKKVISSDGEKGILVVSADIFGLALKDFLLKLLAHEQTLRKRVFYFKLHPNQFQEKQAYIKYFEDYDNVQIISNEHSVKDLIEKCDTLFTIQSTAVYEALQRNLRILLYGISTYYRHGDILEDDNVTIIISTADFSKEVDKPIVEKHYSFFVPFDSHKLNHLLC